ncbi:MAG: YeeE/YedE family protein [Bacteroidales bacterium]|nr:YeeE/YedE family protein [Bacteroidales bacterium]
MEKSKTYMNSYLAGILIGVFMIGAYYFSGEGLGASGALKAVVVATVDGVNHDYAKDAHFFSARVQNEEQSPAKSWLVFEVLGVIAGAILSAALAGRLKMEIIKGPNITNNKRLIFALIGGLLFGIGSQLGRGCTSGMVMSGMGVLSLSGFIGLIAIFGGGYIIAYFFRKLWI